MAAGEGLIGRTTDLAVRAMKVVVEETEKRLGRPVKLKARAKMRAEALIGACEKALCRVEGVTPFRGARTRDVLRRGQMKLMRKVKGVR